MQTGQLKQSIIIVLFPNTGLHNQSSAALTFHVYIKVLGYKSVFQWLTFFVLCT